MLCSRLIQTSSVASWIHKHSLTSYGRHIYAAARQSNLVTDWLLGTTDQNRWNLSTLFIISTRVLLGLISPVSAEKNTGWGGNLNKCLIASCVRNMYAKNYWNLIIMPQVTVNNVWDVFSRFCIFRCNISLGFLSRGSAEADIGWGKKKLNGL